MAPLDKASASRHVPPSRESGDFVPLLPLSRKSRNKNIWAGDSNGADDYQNSRLLQRKSNDSFRDFLDEEEDDPVAEGTSRIPLDEMGEDLDEANGQEDDVKQSFLRHGRKAQRGVSSISLSHTDSRTDLDKEDGRASMSSNISDELKLLADDSPHEEVRAAVSNTDDPEMACVDPCME
jgi:hypothetical protein